jgi:hypothetical protein
MLGLLLLLSATDSAVPTVPVHDGGMCAGLSWTRLAAGEKVSAEQGPDFTVYRFEPSEGSTDGWWGLYSGNFAQVRGNGPLLLKRDGVAVNRAVADGKFRGYLAERKGRQNHFFGSVFDGTARDKQFFDRVDFSARGQALRAKGR